MITSVGRLHRNRVESYSEGTGSMIWLICLLVTAVHFTMLFWKATLERENRWALYALRDELRWAAIENPVLLEDPSFWELDESITRWCRYLHLVSLWPLIVLIRSLGQEALALEEATDESAVRPFRDHAAELLLRHVRQRHPVLGPFALRRLAASSSNLETAAEVLIRRAPIEHDVSQKVVSGIVLRKTWRHLLPAEKAT